MILDRDNRQDTLHRSALKFMLRHHTVLGVTAKARDRNCRVTRKGNSATLTGMLWTMCLACSLVTHAQRPESLPKLVKHGAITQLMVNDAPLLLLAGELHNSSPSSPAYMRKIWDDLEVRHLNAVIGAASWELVEPEEGHFDFAAVDDQVQQAKAHGMRLVLIWFGSFKNASYIYTPMWVKRDPARFPLAQTQSKVTAQAPTPLLRTANTLSAFGSKSVEADARAFAALMAHLRDTDHSHVVVMVQLENETGLRNDSRDRSAAADAAYRAAVPQSLLNWLKAHRETMLPELKTIWSAAGERTNGTWAQVFGDGTAGDEVFMAWYTARYLETVAEAGSHELALPMYANAWLVQFPGQPPGDYPSGGPVSRMMDIWHVAAPGLALLAPDIYLADFDSICESYRREDNPLFIPEARASAANLFIAIGKYNAIGYSPFGIDGPVGDPLLSRAYAELGGMMSVLTKAQANGSVQLIPPSAGGTVDLNFGTYTVHIERGVHGAASRAPKLAPTEAVNQDLPPAPDEIVRPTNPPAQKAPIANTGYLRPFEDDRRGFGLIVPDGSDSFYVVGTGLALTFGSQEQGKIARIGMVDEGSFANGQWVRGRRLNGDETAAAYRIVLDPDTIRTFHVMLYSSPQ